MKPWKLYSEKIAYSGFRKIIKRSFELPDGVIAEYDIKLEGNPVCMFAITEDQHVLMCRQFRPGPQKVLLEMPGGGTEDGETPEEAALRELQEETGYTGRIIHVQQILDDAYSTCERYFVVIIDCQKVSEQELDENEFIDVIKMTIDEFRLHLRSGQLTDIECGYLGLDFLNLL